MAQFEFETKLVKKKYVIISIKTMDSNFEEKKENPLELHILFACMIYVRPNFL